MSVNNTSLYALTQGSVRKHITRMSTPIMGSMFLTGVHIAAELYFISQLGAYALAAAGACGTLILLCKVASQALSAGTISLVARHIGCDDTAQASEVFRHSLCLALLFCIMTLVLGYSFASYYIYAVSSDPLVQEAGAAFLYWYIPDLAIGFLSVALISTLRALGITKPAFIAHVVGITTYLVLAPILINGVGTGVAMGLAGSGLANSVATITGFLTLLFSLKLPLVRNILPKTYFTRLRLPILRQLFVIGWPISGDFGLKFLHNTFIYWITGTIGTDVQAAYSLGIRVLQALFMPSVAIAFSVPAVAGQNLGAKQYARIREAFFSAVWVSLPLIAISMLVILLFSTNILQHFSSNSLVVEHAKSFMTIFCYGYFFIAVSLICSGIFHAFGDTLTNLKVSVVRIVLFIVPAYGLFLMQGITPQGVWWLYTISNIIHFVIILWLMKLHLARFSTANS